MSGHGWVIRNANGTVARCGGPAICRQCAQELTQLQASARRSPPKPVDQLRVAMYELRQPILRFELPVPPQIDQALDAMLVGCNEIQRLQERIEELEGQVGILRNIEGVQR